jgi:XTP/dITP diphosphohydrolase
MVTLLVASNNPGKLREYQTLLEGLPFLLTTLKDAGINMAVDEVGSSYQENAQLKAETYARLSGQLTLADDSGLEVAALGGEPGPRAARYAGENASDRERIDYLLAKLQNVPWEQRKARFCCVIGLAIPGCEVEICRGECEGYITLEPKGDKGFGYDPVFYLPEFGKTMAELSLEEKNKISHRARAAQCARAVLEKWLEKTKP